MKNEEICAISKLTTIEVQENDDAMIMKEAKDENGLTIAPPHYTPESALEWLEQRLDESIGFTEWQKPHFLYIVVPTNLKTIEEEYNEAIYIGHTEYSNFRFSCHIDKTKPINKYMKETKSPVKMVKLFEKRNNLDKCLDLENMIIKLKNSLKLGNISNAKSGNFTTKPEVFQDIVSSRKHKYHQILLCGLTEMIMVGLRRNISIRSDQLEGKEAKAEYERKRYKNLSVDQKETYAQKRKKQRVKLPAEKKEQRNRKNAERNRRYRKNKKLTTIKNAPILENMESLSSANAE